MGKLRNAMEVALIMNARGVSLTLWRVSLIPFSSWRILSISVISYSSPYVNFGTTAALVIDRTIASCTELSFTSTSCSLATSNRFGSLRRLRGLGVELPGSRVSPRSRTSRSSSTSSGFCGPDTLSDLPISTPFSCLLSRSFTNFKISCFIIRPPFPVPVTSFKLMLCSRARLRTAGVANALRILRCTSSGDELGGLTAADSSGGGSVEPLPMDSPISPYK
mmetsp:Transcript_6723/g.19009  ORF Transcript_6723/g.19009 Transcript_6723/m.19009 type:complete len:221 (-) Transcript_6723:569-1231(-)